MASVGSHTALVTHEELQDWAAERKAKKGRKIKVISHAWESREHADPFGNQLQMMALCLEDEDWCFYDYCSLPQFLRLTRGQEVSFRRAMQNMQVLYCHEETATYRIDELTTRDEAFLSWAKC